MPMNPTPNSESPLFSVVVPLYNKRQFVGMTLESVFAQSFQDFEILVVDDGSSDGGPEHVASVYQDPRLRLIRQANAGVSAARNRGIRQSTGRWIAFLDADDCWHPDFLKCLSLMASQHPEVKMLGTALKDVPDHSDWCPEPWQPFNPDLTSELVDDLPSRWMQSWVFCASSVAIRRDLLADMNEWFVEGERHGEDLDLWFRCAEKTAVACWSQAMAAYRTFTSNSLSVSNGTVHEPPFLERMKKRAATGDMSQRQRRSALKFVSDMRVTLARKAHIQGDRGLAFRYLMSSQGYKQTRRWYVTLLMLLMPGEIVQRWQNWRISRVSTG